MIFNQKKDLANLIYNELYKMKRIFIALIIFSFSKCSFDSCLSENDQTKCDNHQINEYQGFSCYKFSYEGDQTSGKCTLFPDDANNQKCYMQISTGISKELDSSVPMYSKSNQSSFGPFFILKKESYSKGEEVIFAKETLSEEDKKRILGEKTCAYLYYGKFFDKLSQITNDFSNYNGYEDIQDKNICFSAEQFPELKDLIDCGYAEIKYVADNKEHNIKTCFYIPGKEMPEDLESFFKSYFIDMLFESQFSPIFEQIEYYDSMKNQAKSNSRRLSSVNYEVIVENKNGKKVKYTDSSNKIEVITKGSEDGKDSDDSKTKNNSNIFKLNILLFFSLVLLNF